MSQVEREAERLAAQSDLASTMIVMDQNHANLAEWLEKVHEAISDCAAGTDAALNLILETIYDNSEVMRDEILDVLRRAQ
jgi:hypothetical protein